MSGSITKQLDHGQLEKEEGQVRETLTRIYRAFEELNAEKLDMNFSHTDELLAYGTDWDEKFVGWNSYKNVHKVQFEALKKFKFETKELGVHINQGTAWVSDRPHWEIETKAGEKIKNDVRITSVLKKDQRSGSWLVVQWHVSVGLKERLHEY